MELWTNKHWYFILCFNFNKKVGLLLHTVHKYVVKLDLYQEIWVRDTAITILCMYQDSAKFDEAYILITPFSTKKIRLIGKATRRLIVERFES